MKTYRAVSLGLPESGKTAYLSCAISYLVRNDENWQIKDGNKDFLAMMNDTERIMQSGAWPDKTRSNNKLEFKVEGNAVTITDWMGEMFEALTDFKAYRDCSEKMKKQFRDSIQNATCLLIFIDGTTIRDHDTTKRIQRCLSGLQPMLEGFHRAGSESKEIAFVVTKCDELTGIAPYCDATGEVSDDLLSQSLQKNFWVFFRYIKDVNNWLSYKVYSVSCLPVKDHRSTTLDHGLVATNNWTLEDMKGQVTPIIDIYSKIDIGAFIGGVVGAFICAWIGALICAWIDALICGWIGALICGWVGAFIGSFIGTWIEDM
ncbi:MAG: hypothetical protein MSQ05_01240 [Akkermansia sp.]|nr:hypothetical protein [Akkermansia sp.]